jgi:hypothetical protein
MPYKAMQGLMRPLKRKLVNLLTTPWQLLSLEIRLMTHKAIQSLIKSLEALQGTFLSLNDSRENFVSIRLFSAP